MKRGLGLLLVLLLMMIPMVGQAEGNSDPREELQDLSNNIYDSVIDGRLDSANTFLTAFTKEWNALNPDALGITLVDNRAIEASRINLENALENEAGTKTLQEAATRFRLAMDALLTEGSPLWMAFKPQLLEAFNTLVQDVNAGNDLEFQHNLNKFLDLYQMVYPALVIDYPSSTLKEVDAEIYHLSTNRMTIVQDKEEHLSHLNILSSDLNALFGDDGAGDWGKSFTLTVIAIVGLILFTLLYVTWRKYKGERTWRYPAS